jgi:hypothetical protein
LFAPFPRFVAAFVSLDPTTKAKAQSREAHFPLLDSAASRDYAFSVENPPPTVDDSGLVRVAVLMQIPKQDGYLDLDVTLQVSQKNGALSAGDVSVRRSRTKS